MDTAELVGKARQGDREAFGRLVEMHWRLAIGVAFTCIGRSFLHTALFQKQAL